MVCFKMTLYAAIINKTYELYSFNYKVYTIMIIIAKVTLDKKYISIM